MFNFIKNKLKKIYNSISSKLQGIFSSQVIDSETLEKLERILLEADTGIITTRSLIEKLKTQVKQGNINQGSDLQHELHNQLLTILTERNYQATNIILLVGINGSGKTTTASKLAQMHKNNGKKVLLVAGDTFRAAATEQLNEWAKRLGVDIVIGKENQDPASVIFGACEKFKDDNYDTLIIDTAGRLQTKSNLMKELEKIGKIIKRQLPNETVSTLLTVDSMLGQNSFDQAQLFNESTKLNGIVLTKLDGTGKGGIVFAITQKLDVPVAYITFGEQVEQIKAFDAENYVHELLNN